jgi:hypothetical protein
VPTYIYRREDGTEFDYVQRMNDDPLMSCPETGQSVKRIITGGAGPLLPRLKTVRYRDGNMVTSQLAKKLEVDPFYVTLEDKREKLKKNVEKAKQQNAEQVRKITGRITEL